MSIASIQPIQLASEREENRQDEGSVGLASFELRIRTPCGGFSVEVHPSDTIELLKSRIQYKNGMAPDAQRLIYGEKQLHEFQTISGCNIGPNSTVHLIPRLRGGKPVIYLRSPCPIAATVRLGLVPQWELSAVYPPASAKKMTGSDVHEEVEWVVETQFDGCLLDKSSGLEVSYLFWEAETLADCFISPPPSPLSDVPTFIPNRPSLKPEECVLLPLEQLLPYLDQALKALSLDTEARTSFITYWLPSFNRHTHVALTFIPQAAYEQSAPLNVTPPPDVVTRVFMVFRGVEKLDYFSSQWEISRQNANKDLSFWRDVVGIDYDKAMRKDIFRVLEWGGMEAI